jgi:hypothetical protein
MTLIPVVGSRISMGPRLLVKENASRAGEVGTTGRTFGDVVSVPLTRVRAGGAIRCSATCARSLFALVEEGCACPSRYLQAVRHWHTMSALGQYASCSGVGQ